jgi:hypothetical protein
VLCVMGAPLVAGWAGLHICTCHRPVMMWHARFGSWRWCAWWHVILGAAVSCWPTSLTEGGAHGMVVVVFLQGEGLKPKSTMVDFPLLILVSSGVPVTGYARSRANHDLDPYPAVPVPMTCMGMAYPCICLTTRKHDLVDSRWAGGRGNGM